MLHQRHPIASLIVLSAFLICFASSVNGWVPPSPPSTESSSSRREILSQAISASLILPLISTSAPSNAAPPFAIMEEELGYFPVTDERSGDTVMVPSKVKRQSTDQAIALAKYLDSSGASMYGAYWCPHCSRQKELFGKEAWKYISYTECAPKGYKSQYASCLSKEVEGYPTWKFANGKEQSGEMELVDIAKLSGYKKKFDASLETGVPPLGGGECAQ